jgi:hypothetical protein
LRARARTEVDVDPGAREHDRDRRAPRAAADHRGAALGQTAEAVAAVPLLATRLQQAGVDAPVLKGLAGIIEGTVDPERWTQSLTAPKPAGRKAAKAA